MRLIFQTITLLLFTTILQAQIKDTIYLWPDKVPNEKMEKHAPVLSNNSNGNVTRISNISNPALVVFEPEKSNNSGVGIIVCPGGGYTKGR